MNRQQRKKLLREGEKIRRLRDQDFQEFLRVSCLSSIGNMKPLTIFSVVLDGNDSEQVSEVFFKNAEQIVAFYHQNGEGKFTKVSLSSGLDLTEIFKEIEGRCREQFEIVGCSDSVINFEVIKTMNFAIEQKIRQPVGHLIFTERSFADMKVYKEEILTHYEHHYGSKKPIHLAIYRAQEAVGIWH